MADNTNAIAGDMVGIFLSTVLTNPDPEDFKEIVCGENLTVDGSADVTNKKTKCGVIVTVGPFGWTFSGTGTHNSAPDTNQISADDLIGIADNNTEVLVRVAHATSTNLVYRQAKGYLSKYSENHNTGDSSSFDFTVNTSGALDITP